MSRRCVTDWFVVLNDLKTFGFSHNDIKSVTKIPVGTLSGFKAGAQPKHRDGEELLKLWCAVTGGDKEDAPKVTGRSYHF